MLTEDGVGCRVKPESRLRKMIPNQAAVLGFHPLALYASCLKQGPARVAGHLMTTRVDRMTIPTYGQTGVRRVKPACCRGCKSPTGKEIANPSWPRVLQGTSRGVS